ncbi:NAD(P)-dependent oxidoreductase [Lysinibacillus sp. RC79]|uniref:SDR family oxidoreductase n=1 Tax=Lysinibacillus sp. RC79 TaxID=3156296 RepID=UPI00351755B0
MKVLLIGATGMLGREMVQQFQKINWDITTIAQSKCDITMDIVKDFDKLVDIITFNSYEIVINTAAMINLADCEQNPDQAYLLNTRIPGLLSKVCQRKGAYYIQISTDHYYTGDLNLPHKEKDDTFLVNEYAKTKYFGEILTRQYSNSLVIRTNIVGFKGIKEKPTFIEWVIETLTEEKEIIGFTDFYTSSIDVESFTVILIQLILKNVTGTINIASSEVISKYEFIIQIARKLNKEYLVKPGSLKGFSEEVERADSLGLCIEKLTHLIGKEYVPSAEQVIRNLMNRYKEM